MMAVTFDHTEISLLLIESGADLEVKIDDGSTVLHAAAFYGRLEIVRALLDKGVNTSARTNDGSTALSSVMMPFDELMPFYKLIEGALDSKLITICSRRIGQRSLRCFKNQVAMPLPTL